MKINIAVFFGCVSVEHEVSIISGVQAIKNLNQDKYNIIPVYVTKNGETVTGDVLLDIENYKNLDTLLSKTESVTFYRKGDRVIMRRLGGIFGKKETVIDLAFPVVHGTNCEDGTIAGLFEFLGLPYIGCDITSSSVGMDKALCKSVLKDAGIPVLDCVTIYAREYAENRDQYDKALIKKIGLPLIIKPVNLGSSVGITVVKEESALRDAITLAFSFSQQILAEHAVSNLKEVNCSVIGDHDNCRASVCEAPIMKGDMLTYDTKYLGGSKSGSKSEGSKGMASLGRIIPADISEEKTEEIQSLAVKTFKALGCSGVVRIDFMIDKAEDKVYVNEINTIPGSLAFYLWEAGGLHYTDMLDELVQIAYKRKRTRENLMFTIDTNILSGAAGFGSKGSKGGKL